MKIFPIIRKILAAAGDGGLRIRQSLGFAADSILTATPAKPEIRLGMSAEQASISIVSAERLGLSAEEIVQAQMRAPQALGLNVPGVMAEQILLRDRQLSGLIAELAPVHHHSRQRLGAAQSSRLTAEMGNGDQRSGLVSKSKLTASPKKTDQRSGADITFEVAELTRLRGGSAWTEAAVGGRTDWASEANVISGTNGKHDGSVATFAGNALGARGGDLRLTYPANLDKSALTIEAVNLHFYGQTAGTVLNNADVRLQWDVGGAVTTLETITGNANFLTTPKTHPIAIRWGHLDLLGTHFRAESALGETWTAQADAVEVEVTAKMKYFLDSSGNDHHALAYGLYEPVEFGDTDATWPGFGQGVLVFGADFNEKTPGVYIPPKNSGLASSFTVECKVVRGRQNVTEVIIGRWGEANSTHNFLLWWSSVDNRFYGSVARADGATVSAGMTSGVLSSAAHDLALEYDAGSTTLRAYVDGVMVQSVAVTGGLQAPDTVTPLWFLRSNQSVAGGAPFPPLALLDEVRISTAARYGGSNYTPASAPFTTDVNTKMLYHFDEMFAP